MTIKIICSSCGTDIGRKLVEWYDKANTSSYGICNRCLSFLNHKNYNLPLPPEIDKNDFVLWDSGLAKVL